MRTVNIHDAKTQLSRLVEDASKGEEIVIAKAGKPMARLVPVQPPPKPRALGWLRGRFDVPEDFDAPLPGEVIAEFENCGDAPSH